MALGTVPGLKLRDSALKSDCSSAAPLQVTSPAVPQFPPETLLCFLIVGLTLPSRDLLNPSCEGNADLLGDHREYCNIACQALTCNHRLGNSWGAMKAQGALPTATRSVLSHCGPLHLPCFSSEHRLSMPPNKGKRTKYKQFSKQMQKTSVHVTLSLLCE